MNERCGTTPENTTLVIARGLVKQELGLPDAVDDFQQALNRGTAVVWPYVELARHALLSGRDHDTVEMCQRGLAFARRDTAKAMLLELLAIALHRLKATSDEVRAAFQSAREFDPLSEKIRINAERFESLASGSGAGEPKWRLDPVPPSAVFDDVYAQLQAAV